ncbi:hypothetical protein CBR_g36803 [Chara braunii]|uniref:CCHC-type domain-containing protein n=1 Tax=Chara braunii TaxID=69332 RepID=A0A388LLL6_CHABU|nr:hypothetical protein CBR_g36803 [Chara braunii]|eukprot:GBG83187.1 hypothetical protein CBR_g36803 [Chara braunii]
MSGSGYREYEKEDYRGRYGERGRDGGYEGGRDPRDSRRERSMEPGGASHQERHREPPRRVPPVCFECGEPEHYRNQCPRLVGDSSRSRGRSTSPRHQGPQQVPRALSEDPALRRQVEDMASMLASMKEYHEAEQAKKEARAKRKLEKQEQKRREEEERAATEEKQLVKQRRAMRKEEKMRKEAEQREKMAKELKKQISISLGDLREELQHRIDRAAVEKVKGKKKIEVHSSDEGSYESHDSDVDTLSSKMEQLVISEKRKRSVEKPVGDSPPMVTAAKRIAKR